MLKLDELTQILYEISISIGTHLSLGKMLRDVALLTLRKFNCTAFAVFEQRQDAGRYHFERVFITPRIFPQSEEYAELEQILPQSLGSHEFETFCRKLPMEVSLEGRDCFHLMALPGYGLLALFRSHAHGFLPPHVVESLSPINKKLAIACYACLSHERLQASEEKYRSLVDNMGEGMVVIDVEGVLTFANQSFADMLGCTIDELLRRPVAEFFDYENKQIFKENFELKRHGKISSYEITWSRKDGSKLYSLISPQIVRDNEGRYSGSFAIITDLTFQKQTERELFQMKKMESIGLLAGGIAHDFNNMLAVIIGHASMAQEEMDSALPLYERLEEIRIAGERSANLTSQLLAFARKQTVSPMMLDFNKTVEGMLKMLQRIIGENIDLSWIPGENVWPVKMDPSQLDQVLANLLVNARDAIADVGKVTIETGNVRFDETRYANHRSIKHGEYVLLGVSDNGCGMDAETLEMIFEPFFTTKEYGQGTGLGLATVYGVVKQNNGFVNVYSEPGQGTIFKIYFPRHSTKTDALPEEVKDHPVERGNETILLVEDETAILEMTTRMLERLGYQVVPASTTGEAIRLAQEYAGKIHLLVSDVIMPAMNGKDLAKNILSIHPNLKCLFMSGYTANVIAHNGVLDKGVNFIQKPFSKEKLGGKVREVLDEAKFRTQ